LLPPQKHSVHGEEGVGFPVTDVEFVTSESYDERMLYPLAGVSPPQPRSGTGFVMADGD